jgi:uncharacterized membrane protein YhaH (DUF805 family)
MGNRMNNIVANFTGFEGRLNRQPFWISAIILAVISIIISFLILPIIGLGIMPAMPTIDANTSAADIASIVSASRAKAGWVSLVLFIIFIYPSAAISIKRRHDRNNNGYDVWGYFVLVLIVQLVSALGIGMTTMDVAGTAVPVPGPIIVALSAIVGIYGIYLLVVLGFLKGTSGPNNYGPDPLQG